MTSAFLLAGKVSMSRKAIAQLIGKVRSIADLSWALHQSSLHTVSAEAKTIFVWQPGQRC